MTDRPIRDWSISLVVQPAGKLIGYDLDLHALPKVSTLEEAETMLAELALGLYSKKSSMISKDGPLRSDLLAGCAV